MIKGHLYKGKTKIPFEIPEGYGELTIDQLTKIAELDDELEIFAALSGVEIETVKQCRKEEVAFIVDQLNDLYKPESLEESKQYIESFELNGTTYFVDKDIISIPAGQWWDIKKYEKDLADNPIEFIPRMLSILCRPKGEEYSHTKSSERLDEFRQLDVKTAFQIRGFFLTNLNRYLTDLNHSLKATTPIRKALRVFRSLATSSVHFLRSTLWQRIRMFCLRCLAKRKK